MIEFIKRLGSSFHSVLFVALLATAASGQLSNNDVQWATNLVNSSGSKDASERVEVLDQVLNRLRPYRDQNAEVRSLIGLLELERDLLRFESRPLTGAKKALSNSDKASRTESLKQLRLDLLDRAYHLVSTLNPANLSVNDAQRIAELVKYTLQAVDDLRDPSMLGGRTADLTRLATRVNGIAKLAESIQNPEARNIIGGLRDTIGTIERRLTNLGVSTPNPMKAFDIPAEVAASIIDTTRKGVVETAAAIDDVGNAIAGDGRALARLADHADRIGRTLSPQNYGRQIADAILKRVTDRFPFLRALAKWLEPQSSLGWLIGKWHTVHIRDSSDELEIDFRQESRGVSGYLVKPNKHAAQLGYKAGDLVYRSLADSSNSTFPRRAGGQCLYIFPDRTTRWVPVGLYIGAFGFEVSENCAIPWGAFYQTRKVN